MNQRGHVADLLIQVRYANGVPIGGQATAARPIQSMRYVAYICKIWHSAFVKPVIWMGGSREEVKRLPEAVQDSLGFELYRVQCGLDPNDWKPMTSVGSGVKEVRVRDEAGIFRMIYLATRPEGVYVCTALRRRRNEQAGQIWNWR